MTKKVFINAGMRFVRSSTVVLFSCAISDTLVPVVVPLNDMVVGLSLVAKPYRPEHYWCRLVRAVWSRRGKNEKLTIKKIRYASDEPPSK